MLREWYRSNFGHGRSTIARVNRACQSFYSCIAIPLYAKVAVAGNATARLAQPSDLTRFHDNLGVHPGTLNSDGRPLLQERIVDVRKQLYAQE